MSEYITVLLTADELTAIRKGWEVEPGDAAWVAGIGALERGVGRGEMPRETTQVQNLMIFREPERAAKPVEGVDDFPLIEPEDNGTADEYDLRRSVEAVIHAPLAEPEPEEDDTPSIGIGRAYEDPPVKAPTPKSKALAQATGPFTVSRELCEAYIVAVVKNGDYGHVWAGVARQLDCTPAARKVVKAALLEHFKPVIDGANRGGYEGSELKRYVADQVRILTKFDGLTIDLGGEE